MHIEKKPVFSSWKESDLIPFYGQYRGIKFIFNAANTFGSTIYKTGSIGKAIFGSQKNTDSPLYNFFKGLAITTFFPAAFFVLCKRINMLFDSYQKPKVDDDKEKLNKNISENTELKEVESNIVSFPDGKERQELMKNVYEIYNDGYTPKKNMKVLSSYIGSENYERHAETARVYYKKGISKELAACIMWKREPVNIAMNQLYSKDKLKNFLEKLKINNTDVGTHEESAFNENEDLANEPNTVCVYSETYLWQKPGNDKTKKEIACLSLPAPALDSSKQPHYPYYVQEKKLNTERYQDEMEYLAKTVIQSFLDNKDTAFGGTGIKRLVISQYGQSAFLGALKNEDKQLAHDLYYSALCEEIEKQKDNLKDVEIVMSEYGTNNNTAIEEKFITPLKDLGLNVGIINGDILKTAKEYDLIINAWDPHSVPGNGNDGDKSLDGVLGGGSGIGPTQLPWLNHHIACDKNFVPFDSSRYKEIE